ncbi:hypothetical protein C7S16_4653 [Burkholderia thailandensis]|uniref:Uncharacterized protein n=1 Tax=Burkholderia thailandensis TaxID=57975 RepID=A0AAW9CRM7_BURTH|nr:hypothetical protein [Burkholderia thailandensis]MDW9253690.1 hypothetical protein [Burkholderia thailandensis]
MRARAPTAGDVAALRFGGAGMRPGGRRWLSRTTCAIGAYGAGTVSA